MRKRTVKNLTAMAIATAISATTVSAASSDSFILFLPRADIITYEYDSDHLSDKYSTNDYFILLYDAGEVVRLHVDTDEKYFIEDAMGTTTYSSYEISKDGDLSFIMPEEDILLEVKDDEGNTIDISELQTETEVSAEAGNAEDGRTEDAQSVNTEVSKIAVNIYGGIQANCMMVNGSSNEVRSGEEFRTSENIDIIVITADGGEWDNPSFQLLKNGEPVENEGDYIINSGGWNGEFKIDLKNGMNMSEDAWTLNIVENGYTIPEPDPQEEAEAGLIEEMAEELTVDPVLGADALLQVLDTSNEPVPMGDTESEVQEHIDMETDENALETLVSLSESNTEKDLSINESEAPAEDVKEAAVLWMDTEAEESEPETYTGSIDPDIPRNYIPVPNRNEMYMVLDENGEVYDYKIRVKVGSEWEWEDVFPGIVDVPDEQDLYMVRKEDGTISFFKYIRNTDSTYMFIETDEDGVLLAKGKPDETESEAGAETKNPTEQKAYVEIEKSDESSGTNEFFN